MLGSLVMLLTPCLTCLAVLLVDKTSRSPHVMFWLPTTGTLLPVTRVELAVQSEHDCLRNAVTYPA